jgi:polyhydroxybutyrate depolymerase
LDVDGTPREFHVVLPDTYDPSRPYPVVFQFHHRGGTAAATMEMFGIRPNFPDAIYVTPQGLVTHGASGWPNTSGGDEAMVRAVMADIEAEYCIDKVRYYSAGFSWGASMAITTACNMSDVFRGIAVMSGALTLSGSDCPPERPVAYWASHGTDDTVLNVSQGEAARDHFVERNGCSLSTQSANPSPCIEYDDCDDGYPVVWCEVADMDHTIPSFSGTGVAEFFQRL